MSALHKTRPSTRVVTPLRTGECETWKGNFWHIFQMSTADNESHDDSSEQATQLQANERVYATQERECFHKERERVCLPFYSHIRHKHKHIFAHTDRPHATATATAAAAKAFQMHVLYGTRSRMLSLSCSHFVCRCALAKFQFSFSSLAEPPSPLWVSFQCVSHKRTHTYVGTYRQSL